MMQPLTEKIKTDHSVYRLIVSDAVIDIRDMLNDYEVYAGKFVDRDTIFCLIGAYERRMFKDKI